MDYLKQANEFLTNNDTTLKIEYKKFGAMSWDTDGQERNIFDVTLSNKNGSYTFEFGTSIVDSCKQVPAIQDVEKVEIFTGVKYENGLRATVRFELTKKQLLHPSEQILTRYAREIQQQIKDYAIENNKNNRYLKMNVPSFYEFVPLISRAIQKQRSELENEMVYSKNQQKEGIEKPSAYDILACLSVYYFESPDEVAEEFGCMKPSQAIAIYEQDQELQKLFNEEQLNELAEIA